MTLRLAITDVAFEVKLAFTSVGDDMAHAATSAMREAGAQLKARGRANITGAGFSSRWGNAWRVNVYPPNGKESLDPAAFGYHKIPYSEVFETGGTINGKRGMLWLPIGNNVPKAGRRKRATPRDLIARGVKLFTMHGMRGRPVLGAAIRVPAAQAGGTVKLTLSKLAKGTKGKSGVTRAVPLFVGVNSVTLRKRFNIAGVANQVAGALGDSYFAALK